jgi:hypothetical protein
MTSRSVGSETVTHWACAVIVPLGDLLTGMWEELVDWSSAADPIGKNKRPD